MANVLAKVVAKKILGENAQNAYGKEDPYFENVPDADLKGRPSKKQKKQRKPLPRGLSKNDARILTKVNRRAHRLDKGLCNCCGIRFGWSSVIGIVPALGDLFDSFMAYMVYRTCRGVDGGLTEEVKRKMLFNIALDFFIGLVPFVGDIADALYRCNTKNAEILGNYLQSEKYKKELVKKGFRPTVDSGLGEERTKRKEDALGASPIYQPMAPNDLKPTSHAQAEGANRNGYAQTGERAGGRNWFGWGQQDRGRDLEMGDAFPPPQFPEKSRL